MHTVICWATGMGPIYYRWEKYHLSNNSWISPSHRVVNNTSPNLNFSVITEEDEGVYRCVVTNDDGSVISDNVTVHVYGEYSVYLAILYGGKLWRVQTLAKWQKNHWQNKLWRIDDKSLIKHILKQFQDTPAPNLSIHVHVCACMLLENDVGWLLSFSVQSRLEATMRGTGVQKGTGKTTRFVVSYQNIQVKWR